jgi:hypothetical protein
MEVWYGMVWYGGMVWRYGMEVWYGGMVWRDGMEVWYGGMVWRYGGMDSKKEAATKDRDTVYMIHQVVMYC